MEEEEEEISSGVFESVVRFLVESVRCLVALSTWRFLVLNGRSKTGVVQFAADFRRNLSCGAHSILMWLK